ncbi:ATP-grasp ribosomal peptide maturase [Actinorhabdospora filicis]|uniref:ATP-grasp ribosomal peptide maturase n=1 Tax=Actinorhabdospora filicis TaxID=1785913 RepID=A0A9W6W709_9ACTN|nr:ATP-grasp ribosomal peptide maturase [Actinorhabdospora filicis]GLZ82117.1 ATP-grasp ribosomal peptide maturase [Actinorhabdospora filicis]
MHPRREPAVLVLTHWFDPTADYVIHELNSRGTRVYRCDPGEFPKRLTLSAGHTPTGWAGTLHTPERSIRLEEITCAWYRRPTTFDMPEGMTQSMRSFALREARMGLGGVLATLPVWLNHPFDLARAEYKPHQLAVAARCGLAVPDTLITSDPDAARRFIARHGRVVYKPFTQGAIAEGDTTGVIYATPVTAAQITDTIGLTAHTLQAQIPKAHELRITAVDDHLFAVRIDARSEQAHVDWRSDYANLAYTAVNDLSQDLASGIKAMMDTHGLRFACMDFIVDPDGVHWFIDLNPNGQWAWLQDETDAPIAQAIADALTRGDQR